jgi:hypothetical protein
MLTLDPKEHVYRLDNQVVPSVTQVLDVVPLDFHCSPAKLAEAKERGQYVHSATAYYDEGTLDDASVIPEIRPYLNAWIRFRAETGFAPVVIERIGCNRKHRYAGTCDCVGTVGKRVWLLDKKSGVPALRSCLQTAAYAELDEIKAEYPKVERYCVQLSDDGKYKMSDQYKSPHDFAVFLGFLTVFNFVKGKA